MKKLGCVWMLVVALALVCGWNWYSTVQLKNSVRAISAKVYGTDAEKQRASGKTDLVTALATVENHTRRARDLIRRNRPKEAQEELDKALTGLNSAKSLSTGIAGDVAEFLGSAREKSENLVRQAWKDISKEVKKK